MLGVTFDSKLNWTSHESHIKNKKATCKKALMMLRSLLGRTWSLRPEYTWWIYEGIILPTLSYGSAVWAKAVENESIQVKLTKLQRLGLTSITHAEKAPQPRGLKSNTTSPLCTCLSRKGRSKRFFGGNVYLSVGDRFCDCLFPTDE
jgi:hypothetical protein